MLGKLFTLFANKPSEEGLAIAPCSDDGNTVVVDSPRLGNPILGELRDATCWNPGDADSHDAAGGGFVNVEQSSLEPEENIQNVSVHNLEDGNSSCTSPNVVADGPRPSAFVVKSRELTLEEKCTKRRRQAEDVELAEVADADISDAHATSAESLVQEQMLANADHLHEAVAVGGRSGSATRDVVTDGERSEAPAEISSEDESSEDDPPAKRRRHLGDAHTELPAETVDVEDSDDELVCFITKDVSKKDDKKIKKRELELDKARRKEKKQQDKLQDKERKQAKKQRKLEKRQRAEREARERARHDKKATQLQAEREALERTRQQRRDALEVQLRRDAEEEARCKADAAARRFALRLDLYDAGVRSEVGGKKQLVPLRPKRPPKAKAEPSSSPPTTDAAAVDPIVNQEDTTHDSETPAAPQTPKQPDAPDSEDAPPSGSATAEAVAEALPSPSEDAEPSSCFASFESFDAQAAYAKAHPTVKEPEPPRWRAKWRRLAKPQKTLLPEEFFSLRDLPQELKPEIEFGDESAFYVAHFVRWALGAWQHSLHSGEELPGAGLTQEIAMFLDEAKLHETSDAVAPLLRQLRSKDIHKEVLKQLLSIVRLAASRSYASAISEYMDITMGKKTWHQSMSQMQMQQNHGGSIARILKQSPLLEFDWDPVVQAYIWALKRLIQFAQCVRPPEIASERA